MNVPPNYSQYPRSNQGGSGGFRGPGVYFDMIGDGFQMLMRTPKVYLGAGAICVGMFGVAYVAMLVTMFTIMPKQSGSSRSSDLSFLGPLLAMYAGLFIVIFFMRMLMVGVSICAIEDADTGRTSFQTLFSIFRRFGTLFATLFLSQLFILLGTIFCYVPGIYLMGVLAFAPELSIVENLGPIQAMQRSYDMIKPHAWMMALLMFVLSLLAGAGSMACIVGMAFTMPVQYIVVALHYREFRGQIPGGFAPNAPGGPAR